MPSRRSSPTASPATPGRRRAGIFHRESTRLRSNVADQVQRDLLPAGRMLSVFLILCELLAEVAVLIWSRGQSCDRPLRFWVQILIFLQAGTVVLNCLNIWQGRDSFGQHRNGLSATEIDMYNDAPASYVRAPANPPTGSSMSAPSATTADNIGNEENNYTTYSTPFVVDVRARDSFSSHLSSIPAEGPFNDSFDNTDTQPLLYSRANDLRSSQNSDTDIPNISGQSSSISNIQIASSSQAQISSTSNTTTSLGDENHSSSSNLDSIHVPTVSFNANGAYVSPEFVDRYVRIVNAWYLIWFILGSVWVSDGGTCSTTAPHLYRLIVALTIIYYALLFLPLACFCLIVCCLPLFILVYRIMLPYAERERRRARAADPEQVQNLNSIVYSPEAFTRLTGNENLDDASCVICLCDYEADEIVRFLPCKHHFHKDCVDVWLRLDKACCLCKQDIDVQPTPTPMSAV